MSTAKFSFFQLMAGRGMRFKSQLVPKPIVPVAGHPLFSWPFRGLKKLIEISDVYLVLCAEDNLSQVVSVCRESYLNKARLIELPVRTCGPVESALSAALQTKTVIGPIVFMDCDFYVDCSGLYDLLSQWPSPELAAAVTYVEVSDPANSFIQKDEDNFVQAIAEKRMISRFSVVGIYAFRDLPTFLRYASTFNFDHSEIYFSHLLDEMIKKGEKIKAIPVEKYLSFGTPEHIQKNEVEACKVL